MMPSEICLLKSMVVEISRSLKLLHGPISQGLNITSIFTTMFKISFLILLLILHPVSTSAQGQFSRAELPQIYSRIKQIVAQYDDSESINVAYNYASGFTLVGTDEKQLDTTGGVAFGIASDIHEIIGPEVIVNLASNVSRFQDVFATAFNTSWSVEGVASEVATSTNQTGLFLSEDTPAAFPLSRFGKRLAHCEAHVIYTKKCTGDVIWQGYAPNSNCITTSYDTYGKSVLLVNHGCCTAVWSLYPHHACTSDGTSVTMAGGYQGCRNYNIYSLRQDA